MRKLVVPKEILDWFTKADRDLRAAKNSIKTKDYEWAAFQAHQAAEKVLKALYILKFKELRKVHDLKMFAERVGAPEEIIKYCENLNPHYIKSRYFVTGPTYTMKIAEKAVEDAKRVIKWAKGKIKEQLGK